MTTVFVPGLLYAFRFAADGRGQQLVEDVLSITDLPEQSWIWVHLNLSDWRSRRWLGDTFGLPRDLVTEFADFPARQHVSAWRDVLFGHLADFQQDFDGKSMEFAWLHFVLGDRFLVTGRV